MELISEWITSYGYFGLFILLVLGIVGIPVPDETLLTFAGYLIFKHKLELYLTFTSAFLGSICGISMSYWLGRSVGFYLIHKYGHLVFITNDKVERVHEWFIRRGRWTLVVGYFIPGVRHLTAYIAGGTKLEWPVFMLFAYSGALIWATTFILLGYFLGDHWQIVLDQFQKNLVIGTVLLVIIIGTVWFIKKKFIRL
jgi:membrane protein DedA with SNARE-associated domain